MTTDGDYGEREVTPEDRRRAVLHDLIHSRSNVRITEGMRRGLAMTADVEHKRRRMRRWRRVRQLRAFLTGYFWLPCPACGERFAGYEVGEFTYRRGDLSGGGKAICPACAIDPRLVATVRASTQETSE